MPNSDQWDQLNERLRQLGVDDADLTEQFILGSGSGGQKINKTSSCVFLKHLPSGTIVKCQAERSREQNRYLARVELCNKLEAAEQSRRLARKQASEKRRRQHRKPSAASKRRTLDNKSKQSIKKKLRKPPTRND